METPHPDQRDWMRRAIELAMGGRGRVEPNPMVGCVIVKNHRVIGQGRHEFFGGPHAEPNTLKNCTESPAGATAYVTLEPCVHTAKKTPPCVPRLIEAKLNQVAIGCIDPNRAVAGAGMAALQAAGIQVSVGILENHCRQLIAPYIATTVHHRPYVTLKWAQTADGAVAGPGGRRLHISGDAAQRAVHALRGGCDAILIGGQTAERDDPLLTVRLTEPLRIPLRIVLSAGLRLSPDSQLAHSTDWGPVLVYCTIDALDRNRDLATALRKQRVEILALTPDHAGQVPLDDVMSDLHRRHVTHLLVEPGPNLASRFFAAGLADRVWVFRSPIKVDDSTAPLAAPIPFSAGSRQPVILGDDQLIEYLNPQSPVFFADDASADLLMTR